MLPVLDFGPCTARTLLFRLTDTQNQALCPSLPIAAWLLFAYWYIEQICEKPLFGEKSGVPVSVTAFLSSTMQLQVALCNTKPSLFNSPFSSPEFDYCSTNQ
jgi:hypothetical protein